MIGKVLESSANEIITQMKFEDFEHNKNELKIGKYIKIEVGNHDYLIASIKSIKAVADLKEKEKYLMVAEPVGVISNDEFIPGSTLLPSPTEEVGIAEQSVLDCIFQNNDKYAFPMGRLIQNNSVTLHIDGNVFFGKHIGIVGSTGSGKSCTVAKILQEVVGIKDENNIHVGAQKNAHIIIFDIHSEYKAAFSLEKQQGFSLNYLDVEKLKLPYWLMNSEELESIFIESNEANSHNQISQFRRAVILNKEKYNPSLSKVTYDTPVYFSIEEVYNYIYNMNEEVISKLASEDAVPKIIENGQQVPITDKNRYFEKKFSFIPPSTAKDSKATNGPFNGEFNRFISRLENKINDKRLEFVMNPQKSDGSVYMSEDFEEILKQFLGYLNRANVSIIDLSGIPFEILSITISLITRIIFDFCFHYSKLKHARQELNNVPFLIVCEEAHNYVPKNGGADYVASKKSIERIAKEGRKYGISLMVVSQRPSEVSDTIFAQCNNFVSLRLTNTSDQAYIKNLLPNNTNSVADVLPTLQPGQCLIVGDATPLPSIVQMEKPKPEPQSKNVSVCDVWNEEWKKIDQDEPVTITDVLERWRK
ncbi:MAG: ATP-binding protein [Lachnospiraceae bacterium]|nr:ATP-binding protein [Lachnospiraceae bacterium]